MPIDEIASKLPTSYRWSGTLTVMADGIDPIALDFNEVGTNRLLSDIERAYNRAAFERLSLEQAIAQELA